MAALLLLSAFATIAQADEKAGSPSPVDAQISITKQLVTDVTNQSLQRDTEFELLLKRFAFAADTDWEKMRVNPEKVERTLSEFCQALLALAATNGNAKVLVQKYQIRASAP